jgi:GNAT superfamily N-acetyltransferase
LCGETADEYVLVEQVPEVEQYRRLREAVGWETMDPKSTKIGLQNSIYSVCVYRENNLVGYGRVIGDWAIHFYIQDVMVLPEYQGKGIGTRIMNYIMRFLKEHGHPNSYFGLFAAKGKAEFYEKFGFIRRDPDGPGMFQWWPNKIVER